MSKNLPVLYSFRRCPYAMRARLALAGSKVVYELREVVLRNKPAELLAASPKATVPVLVLPNQTVIDESLDIMLWALEQNDPHKWLKPDLSDLKGMLALISENDTTFKNNLDRYKYPNRFDLDSGLTNRDAACEWLQELNNRLSSSPWLFGAQQSLADMAIAPFVRQFAHVDRDWFYAQNWKHLANWLKGFLADPLFEGVMKKHPPWEPGQSQTD